MLAPDWAVEIVKEVCLANNREVPEIRWHIRKKRLGTSGSYRPKSRIIVVSAGQDHLEKQVLLHELSHLIDRSGVHDGRFYLILKDLLIKYDCLTEEYKKREGEYRKTSLKYL